MKIKEIAKKPIIKYFVLFALTFLYDIVTNKIAGVNPASKIPIGVIIVLILFGIMYLTVTFWYAKEDTNDRRVKEIQDQKIFTYETIMSSLITLCQENTEAVNNCIHDIQKLKSFDKKTWDFDKACRGVCDTIYHAISGATHCNSFEVAYVKLLENGIDQDSVELVAFSNEAHRHPSTYRKMRSFKETSSTKYHDLELFSRNIPDIDIIICETDLIPEFAFLSTESRNRNTGRYKQYIAIPVFCHNSKMVGLLQVACFQKGGLGKTKEELEELANKYLVPFANYILLLFKLEKALTVSQTSVK